MPDIINTIQDQHVMLMYEDEHDKDLVTITYINQGIKERNLCIYASVNASNTFHISKISSQIQNYQESIDNKNLLIIDLKPFYESALKDDITPFVKLEQKLRHELDGRENKNLLIIADCADNLFSNKHFDQCNIVEKWWHDTYHKWVYQYNKEGHTTIICPYSGSLLSKYPFGLNHYKVSFNHSQILDTKGRILEGYAVSKNNINPYSNNQNKYELLRILIVEPDSEIQNMYRSWLKYVGIKDISIVEKAKDCFEILQENKGIKGKKFDVIIIDSHIMDIRFVQIVKQIEQNNPKQKIIFTTTLPYDLIKQDIDSCGFKINSGYNIIIKPFHMRDLLSLIYQCIRED